MSDLSPRLGLPFLMPAQAQKHVTVNEALLKLDLRVQLALEAFGAETPPTLPAEGAVWALGPTPAGAWAGQGGRLAAWFEGGWLFLDPAPGWRAAAGTDLRIWSGSAWAKPDLPVLDNLPGVGINTAHDAANRLALAAEASLFTHEGAGHRLKINKAAPAETGSVLFQTGWSGRAEFGLAGSDDFSVKVSPDGSAWHEALLADRASGHVTLPGGATVNGALTGTAVMAGNADATPGRLMTPGAFGWGLNNTSLDLPGSNANTLTINGVYRATSATTGNPFTSLAQVLHLGQSQNVAVQIWANSSGTPGTAGRYPAAIRYRNTTGTWLATEFLLGRHNIAGTVGQSGGLPTGAIIERGANANGEYTRWADGTQLCCHTLAGSAGGATAWTFPAAFAAAPALGGAVQAAVLSALCLEGAPGTTAASFSLRDKADARRADTVTLIAAGRWF